MNQKSNHLVLSPSYELNKDKTLLYLIFKRRRGTEQTRHKKSGQSSNCTRSKYKGKLALQIATDDASIHEPGSHWGYLEFWREYQHPELAQVIDSRSICGTLLRITRINTDRFKQLSNALKSAFDRCLKNRTTRTEQTAETESTDTPLFTCGSTSYNPVYDEENLSLKNVNQSHGAPYTEHPIHRKQTNR